MKGASVLISCIILLASMQVKGQAAVRFSVVINEFFADPAPSNGLPSSEFVELMNITNKPIDLYGWRLADRNSFAIIKQHFVLQPDSAVIICSSGAADDYMHFGATIGLSGFPSLDNESDHIILYSDDRAIIHALSYDKKWYANSVKEEGGWTLEMIDVENPCGAKNNWMASTSENGGTPGKRNSVAATNQDELSPVLLRTYPIDSIRIVAVFDEGLDSVFASFVANYSLDNAARPISAQPVAPLFSEVVLTFEDILATDKTYELAVNNVTDCSGNKIGIYNKTKAAVALPADTGSIVINEILFNTKSGDPKFIEIYNKGNYAVNCNSLYVGNKTNAGIIENLKQVSSSPFLLFPGEYLALTMDSTVLGHLYLIKNPSSVIEIPSLPSVPEDKGRLVLLNKEGAIIDDLSYDKNWHFALLKDDEGVALERLDYNHLTQDKHNWTSAASVAGYATPGYQNSQFRLPAELQGELTVFPTVFSPDNDGIDDYAIIEYNSSEPAQMATVVVFNSQGKLVRQLANNQLAGNYSRIVWDGLDEKKQRLPIGIYIIYIEVFSLDGKTRKMRKAITLAKRF
jgi:hypothetical protein